MGKRMTYKWDKYHKRMSKHNWSTEGNSIDIGDWLHKYGLGMAQIELEPPKLMLLVMCISVSASDFHQKCIVQ